jgi:hypothetical protein
MEICAFFEVDQPEMEVVLGFSVQVEVIAFWDLM